MNDKLINIGISGGTFDPIHYGHLIIAEEIRERMSLDRIIFLPSGTPPHKDYTKVTAAEHRFNMVKKAIETNPGFEVSRMEIEREGFTYTVDTLTQLKAALGPDYRLFFITGADVIPELITWRSIDRVFKLCEFIAVLRPGYTQNGFTNEIQRLKEQYNAIIHTIDAPLIGISSTVIRERSGQGKSIKYLVPEAVEEYIYTNGLYRRE